MRSGFTLVEVLVVVGVIAALAAILFPVFSSARESARKAQCLSHLRQVSQAFLLYAQDADESFPYRITDYHHWGGAGIGESWPPQIIPPWTAQVEPYFVNRSLLACPSTRRDWSWPLWAGRWGALNPGGPWLAYCGYRGYGSAIGFPHWDCFTSFGYNEAISNGLDETHLLARFKAPSQFVLLGDSEVAWFTPWGRGEIWGLTPSGVVQRLAFSEKFPPPMETDPEASKETRHGGGSQIAFCDGHVRWEIWFRIRRWSYGGPWRFHPEDDAF
ncbi:MAG: DUF1559 domain-containing protein [Armatimonadetes bacterium]|nr:DUF1559 domain-containing protein [Armatimonadota bacterium]MDW8122919.1 DUF1559 domain-containing protein [Armatimonadota bacterium]